MNSDPTRTHRTLKLKNTVSTGLNTTPPIPSEIPLGSPLTIPKRNINIKPIAVIVKITPTQNVDLTNHKKNSMFI